MRIRYDKITLERVELMKDLFPDYDIICDGDNKEIILKEKIRVKKL